MMTLSFRRLLALCGMLMGLLFSQRMTQQDNADFQDALHAYKNTESKNQKMSYAAEMILARMHERPWVYGLPMNINKVNAIALMDLPGIGPTLSMRIVRYKNENGAFQDVSGLDDVKGIGPATLRKIKPHIAFE